MTSERPAGVERRADLNPHESLKPHQKTGLSFYGVNGAATQAFRGGIKCVANPPASASTTNLTDALTFTIH